jgi:hypothetical protein
MVIDIFTNMFGQNLKSLTLTKHRMQGNPDGGSTKEANAVD